MKKSSMKINMSLKKTDIFLTVIFFIGAMVKELLPNVGVLSVYQDIGIIISLLAILALICTNIKTPLFFVLLCLIPVCFFANNIVADIVNEPQISIMTECRVYKTTKDIKYYLEGYIDEKHYEFRIDNDIYYELKDKLYVLDKETYEEKHTPIQLTYYEHTRKMIKYELIEANNSMELPIQTLDDEETECWYFYNELSKTEKSLYCFLLNELKEFNTRVEFNEENVFGQTFSDESLMKVFTALEQDHPEYFWITNSFGYAQTQNKTIVWSSSKDDVATLEKTLNECNTIADEIILQISSDWSEYKKAKYIYNYILENLQYTDDKAQHFNIGALLTGKTNCNGYAHIFKFLCDKAKIPCLVVYGAVPSGWHAWNAIKIDDKWCWVDCTLADSTNNKWFYFCMTDEELAIDHTLHKKAAYGGWETTETFDFPECFTRPDEAYAEEFNF